MAIQSIKDSQNYFKSENMPRVRAKENSSQRAESVTISTDKVDSEIDSLKAKGLALAKSINNYDDEDTRLQLKDQLKQIQDELRRKDNDIYRRQHADISLGVDVMA